MWSIRFIAALVAGTLLLSAKPATAQDLEIADHTLISSQRVGRTAFEYTYSAQITNAGIDVQNVTATLTSLSAHTTVVEAELNFGDVASGATVTSSDTVTIRQNRRYPFSWDNMRWDFSFQTGTLSITLDQGSKVTEVVGTEGGSLSTIGSDGRSYTLSLPADALQSAQEISLTPVNSIEGLPISQGVLAAVHLAPSGLQLENSATLTIQPAPTQSDRKIPFGFLVRDDGRGLEKAVLDIQGDNAFLHIPHFTIVGEAEISVENMVDVLLGTHEQFLQQLPLATSCTDLAMEEAIDLILKQREHVIALPIDVTFDAQDCVYYEGMDKCENETTFTTGGYFETKVCEAESTDPAWRPGGPRHELSKCTDPDDFVVAAAESLQNRITEIFKEKDAACKTDPDAEQGAIDCITVAGFLSSNSLSEESDFPETLAEDTKECGISSLEVIPDPKYMTVGDTFFPFQAVARDKAGNELIGREVTWFADSNFVTMVDDPHTARITAEKIGTTNLQASDKTSWEGGHFSHWSRSQELETWPIRDHNYAESKIFIGGAVEVSPSNLVLLASETGFLDATLFADDGTEVSAFIWSWTSSNTSVASVVENGTFENKASVFAHEPGTAIITATEGTGGLSGAAEVVVGAKMIVTPDEVCLPVSEAAQLSAAIVDINDKPLIDPDPYDIVWYTPANSVVSVSIDGVAVAHSPGEVQIEASYNNLTGFSTVTVPEFLDYNDVTPVFSPPTFVVDGGQYKSQYQLDDARQVVNVYEEAFKVAKECAVDEELPLQIVMNNTGLFAYPYSDYYAYIYDSINCEEFEIPIDAQLFPAPVAINDNAQVAGNTVDSLGFRRGFVYDLESNVAELISQGCGTELFDINNNGDVIGEAGPCFSDPPFPEDPEKLTIGYSFIHSDGETIKLPNDIPGVPMEEGDGLCVMLGDIEICNNDPTRGLEWIRPSAINDDGVIVGSYRYWDQGFGWFRVKGFIYYQGEYLLVDPPPFPSTLPEQGQWSFLEINNYGDILISSQPRASEDFLKDFTLSAMHTCPLE